MIIMYNNWVIKRRTPRVVNTFLGNDFVSVYYQNKIPVYPSTVFLQTQQSPLNVPNNKV